jgi:GTP-binding protein
MKWGKANMKGERNPTRRAQKKARAANNGDASRSNTKPKKAVHAPGIKRNARVKAQEGARVADPKSPTKQGDSRDRRRPRPGPITVGQKIEPPQERLPTRSTHDDLPEQTLPGGIAGLPIVAVVGRPNVGKSTLFNRLARRSLAIVDDQPGVTRDRHYADTSGFGRRYTIIDTGGFDPEDKDPMKSGIAQHVRAAVAEADVIVFVADASAPLTGADRAAMQVLRQTSKPVFFAANKADTQSRDADAYDLYRAGADKVYPVSALHGRGMGDLENALVKSLPPEEPAKAPDEKIARVAIVGRPNAGKSSLLNKILGEDRMMVSAEPGTTRDAIDALVTRKDKTYIFSDTAGIRKKGRVTKAEDQVESLSVMHAIRSIERSDVTVLVCDAADGVAEQDAKILGLSHDRGRGLVVALNKCDLLDKSAVDRAETLAREKLSFAPYARIARISAKTGQGISGLFNEIDATHASFLKRIGTGELNRFFAEVLDTHPPPTSNGKAPRIFYLTQAEVAPPTFIAITNAPDAIHFSYRRFVTNQLRKRFDFEGVPLRVFYKNKRRREKGA